MRKVLVSEIKNERCNAALLGGYNSLVESGMIKQGEPLEGAAKNLFEDVINDYEGSSHEKYVKIKGAEIDRALVVHIAKQMKQLGINEEITFNFKNLPKGTGGSVMLNEKGKANTVNMSINDISQFKNFIAHELTHVKQINSGKLSLKKDGIYWGGKMFISSSDYDKIARKRSKNIEGFNKYKSLPWESEAYGRGDKYKLKTQSPQQIKVKRKNMIG